MSNDRRSYRLHARAARQQETRERIVAATAALHAELGPARTTVAEIARRAGVQRLTVYNHFPEPSQLLRACQQDFLAGHPPPDLAPQPGAAPLERLRGALTELYAWFRANESMERNVHRDRYLVPDLDALLRLNADRSFTRAADAYAQLVGTTAETVSAVRRVLRLAFEFRTWDLLASEGATDAEIAKLFVQAISCLSKESTAEAVRGSSP